ncbi:MAG TPA: DciA family protein [Stellaceae bacterium]|nr:DciA family protein [Stellaceae bacterium]
MPRTDADRDAERLAAAAPERERRPGLRAVGGTAARVAGPIVARSGGGLLGRLKADWDAIAGEATAAETWPEALSRAGVLRLRVASPGAALDLQHRTPLLIERIDLFFGRRVVERIALVQGPLPLGAATSPVPRKDSLSAAAAAALDARLADIADPALREALGRLGRLVIGRDAR